MTTRKPEKMSRTSWTSLTMSTSDRSSRAPGTSPATIVWTNTGFRPEHRAALDWLNEHSDPSTRFFGVEIDVVQIGNSIPAPNFKLVAQPNDWEKHVKAATAGHHKVAA
jgi:hypothetical protein